MMMKPMKPASPPSVAPTLIQKLIRTREKGIMETFKWREELSFHFQGRAQGWHQMRQYLIYHLENKPDSDITTYWCQGPKEELGRTGAPTSKKKKGISEDRKSKREAQNGQELKNKNYKANWTL